MTLLRIGTVDDSGAPSDSGVVTQRWPATVEPGKSPDIPRQN